MTPTVETVKPSRPFRKWTGRLCVLALLVVIGVTVWFRMTADESPYATLLLFGPRWAALVPLAALAMLSLLTLSIRGLLCCIVMAAIIAGPFMGGVMPSSSSSETGMARIVTFNADAKAVDKAAFKAFLETTTPAIIALQDADRITDADFPSGWKFAAGANGIKLAAKYPVKLIRELSDDRIGPARGAAQFSVSFPGGDQTVYVVHLPTPRPGLEAMLSRTPDAVNTLQGIITKRNMASKLVREWIGEADARVIICGDFNLPVESVIYQRDWSGFQNAFNAAGEGWGHTMFSRQGAVRIDHVLMLKGRVIGSATVGPDLQSAHRPVIVDYSP